METTFAVVCTTCFETVEAIADFAADDGTYTCSACTAHAAVAAKRVVRQYNKQAERIVVAEWEDAARWTTARYGTERIVCTTRLIATDDYFGPDGQPEWRLVSEGDKRVQMLHSGGQVTSGPRYAPYWDGSATVAERLATLVVTPAAV